MLPTQGRAKSNSSRFSSLKPIDSILEWPIRVLFKSVLFVSGEKLDSNFARAINNIPMHDILPAIGANVYDILRKETLVLTKESAESLVHRLSTKDTLKKNNKKLVSKEKSKKIKVIKEKE